MTTNYDVENTSFWLKTWKEVYGFPDSYLAFDLETTGLIKDLDLITEIGLSKVSNGKETERQLIVIDWTRDPFVNQFWLKLRLKATSVSMARLGRSYHCSYEKLYSHSNSVNPKDALSIVISAFEDSRNKGIFLVGHNVWGFDSLFIESHVKKVLNLSFKFRTNDIMDTGSMEKGMALKILPWPYQDLYYHHQRVADRSGKGISWSLSDHCVHKYDLVKRYSLDLAKAHTADYDAYMTHLLFKTYSEIADSL